MIGRNKVRGWKGSLKTSSKISVCFFAFLFVISLMVPALSGGHVISYSSEGLVDDVDSSLNDYDHEPMPEALDAMESCDNVTVTEVGDSYDSITFEPVGVDPVVGYAFGSGGYVDPACYAPAARAFAEEGFFVVLFYPGVGMPTGGPFEDVIDDYPEIEIWSVGGHSNGGVYACEYFDDHEPAGLNIWASYPNPGFIGIGETDLSDKEGEFMSIYGTNDGVTEVSDIEDSEQRLPEDTEFVEIVGGNHAQFGWYGDQSGDNEADITREEQQGIVINATLDHLESLWGYHLTINADEGGTTDPEVGTHHYGEDEEVTVTVTPDEGWAFCHWSGDVSSTDEEITILMDQDMNITAHFVEEDITTTEIELYLNDDSDGWNFISFNLDIPDADLEEILEDEEHGISGSFDRVLYHDPEQNIWHSYVPDRPDHFNDVRSWDSNMGIWIRMTEDDTLTIEGTEPETTDIVLYPGWNMVGLPIETAGNHGLPAEVTTVGYFDPSQEYNLAYDHDVDTFEFHPCQGYWIYNSHDHQVIWTINP